MTALIVCEETTHFLAALDTSSVTKQVTVRFSFICFVSNIVFAWYKVKK